MGKRGPQPIFGKPMTNAQRVKRSKAKAEAARRAHLASVEARVAELEAEKIELEAKLADRPVETALPADIPHDEHRLWQAEPEGGGAASQSRGPLSAVAGNDRLPLSSNE